MYFPKIRHKTERGIERVKFQLKIKVMRHRTIIFGYILIKFFYFKIRILFYTNFLVKCAFDHKLIFFFLKVRL